MQHVLGIDAAWTESGSSGVALLRIADGKRSVLKLASSYAEFTAYRIGGKPTVGTSPDVEALLRSAENIADARVDLVAIDMPMAHSEITGYRSADRAVSKAFGASGASTHTPNAERPGCHGKRIADAFAKAGYLLDTNGSRVAAGCHALVEVYPLPALVRLMDVMVLPAYKVTKMAKYFRNAKPPLSRERIDCLLQTWEKILADIRREISCLRFELPDRSTLKFASELKPYEDQLDALISAWVGVCVLEERAEPFGNDDCAIWIPCQNLPREP